jgi:hypothetical protein
MDLRRVLRAKTAPAGAYPGGLKPGIQCARMQKRAAISGSHPFETLDYPRNSFIMAPLVQRFFYTDSLPHSILEEAVKPRGTFLCDIMKS